MSAFDNYPEAAGKHVEDARVLHSNQRFDGAGYLAGYAVECVLKTIVQVEKSSASGHDLNKLSMQVLKLSSLATARTARYIKNSAVTTMQYRLPAGWEVGLRYRPAGTINEVTANSWLAEASRLYTEIILAMKLDGVIP